MPLFYSSKPDPHPPLDAKDHTLNPNFNVTTGNKTTSLFGAFYS